MHISLHGESAEDSKLGSTFNNRCVNSSSFILRYDGLTEKVTVYFKVRASRRGEES